MTSYDVVIVGARAAGAATAMLLARAGHRVLVVDRARYGSDTLSTHALMRGGVLQLDRWGVLDRIIAAGTPPVRRVSFEYGGAPVAIDLDDPLYAPRRTVLDRVLIDAAQDAGADVRFGVHVTGLRRDVDGQVTGIAVRTRTGQLSEIGAHLTVGADGMRSGVARWTQAPVTRNATSTTAAIYGYYSDVPADGYEWYYGPDAAAGLIPTNDGRVCVFVGGTPARFHGELRADFDAAIGAVLQELAPAVAARVAAGRRDGPLRGFPGLPGWLRRPFGAGWALVGDAGYFKDPLTAHGITDALRDAELLARAAHDGLSGTTPMQGALAGYERLRDDLSLPLFTITDTIASFGWRLPELQALHIELSAEMQQEARFLAGLGQFPIRRRQRAAAVPAPKARVPVGVPG